MVAKERQICKQIITAIETRILSPRPRGLGFHMSDPVTYPYISNKEMIMVKDRER
jgi:hypothetical protein